MEIFPIAHFRSPMRSKFGIPRQSGLVSNLTGSIVFEPDFRRMEAIRGLEDFDYLWIIWEFSEGRWKKEDGRLTSRPPRLGGNKKMGVFATRSPFRPNNLGLSCVKIDHIEDDPTLGPVIYVRGADLISNPMCLTLMLTKVQRVVLWISRNGRLSRWRYLKRYALCFQTMILRSLWISLPLTPGRITRMMRREYTACPLESMMYVSEL